MDLQIVADHVAQRFASELAALGAKAPKVLVRALDHTGAKARTAVVRELTAQTGLSRKVIARAVVPIRAAGASPLSYRLRAKGGDVALKYFGARETRSGVSAAPWGERHVYAGTFLKGGRFPHRVSLHLGGQVFARAEARLPIHKQKSGLYIPRELIIGRTAEGFRRVVATDLAPRVAHELGRLLGG